ncbi:T-cell surface glycoprotein CD8 alpha chain [Aplochiton taeniatus]
MAKNTLIINPFNKEKDSGAYSCASLNNNMLYFGEVTRLHAKPVAKEACDPRMWGPLASGCGLLFLLLIVTICYCNRIRTRRCPHHYKRQ